MENMDFLFNCLVEILQKIRTASILETKINILN